MACSTLADFIQIHENQIKAIGFPSNLVSGLYNELSTGESGANLKEDTFEIKKLKNSRPILLTKKALKKHSRFYLIEHIWTNDGGTKCFKQLKKSPELAKRLSCLFNTPQLSTTDAYFNYDDQINVVKSVTNCSIEVAKKAVQDYHGCTISATQSVLDCDGTEDEQKEQKVATQEEKGTISIEEFKEALKANGDMPEDANEQFLKKMYENFCSKRVGSGITRFYNWEDEDDVITVYVPIPNTAHKNAIKSQLTRTHWTLSVNGKQVIDGDLHNGVKADDSYWSIESPGMLCMTLEKILDDTWPVLLKDEEKLHGDVLLQVGWAKRRNEDIYYNDILDTMWRFNQTYSLASPDNASKTPQWYVMDEIGSALFHNNHPNMKCSPFFFSVLGRAYSLMWPIQDISVGSMCTRNFVQQIHTKETMDILNLRLRVYSGEEERIAASASTEEEEPVDESEPVTVQELTNTSFKPVTQILNIHADDNLANNFDENITRELRVSVSSQQTKHTNISIVSLASTNVLVEGEVLPSSELFTNKDYLQNYLLLRFGRPEWLTVNHILPMDLVNFNADYQKCNTVQYWLVKPVDERIVCFEKFVSSQYPRIVRMCETGSIAVTRYIDQLEYRRRKVTFSYPVTLDVSTNNVYVHKQPAYRLSESTVSHEEMIDEYDNSSSITVSPTTTVFNDTAESFAELKVSMNKLLLPKDPDKGWNYVECKIFQVLGKLGTQLLKDISPQEGMASTKTFIQFNVDVIVGDDLKPRIVDIITSGIFPNKSFFGDLLKISLGCERSTFVKI